MKIAAFSVKNYQFTVIIFIMALLLGMNALFTATFLCLGPLQFALIGAAPYIHIGWSAQSRPVVRLQVPE